MKRKEPMGSLNKKETQSGTSTCQSPGKDDKIEKFSLQKGNKKIRKHFEIRKFPTVAIQNKLIEYYEHENPDFKIAKKQVDDGENRTNILDRIDGDELKSAYIRGLIILYNYGRVSMGRFEINTNFIGDVLRVHPNCTDDKNINPSQYNPENKDLWELVMLSMRIDVGMEKCKVNLDAVKNLYMVKEKIRDDYFVYPKEENQNILNLQDEKKDNYWEDWNKRTMEEQNETGQLQVSNIQHSDKGKSKMDKY
uniref:Uncharacterized protein n=1 Tax=Meloidogyne incognita TaxID=6306 RepID=A0A914LNY6_MELIC